MAYDIGPVIGIEGEREFRESIRQINDNMRTLGTEMRAVASQFDRNDNSTEALTAKNNVLNRQIEEQKNKLSELGRGLAAATERYGENDRVTQGWQRALNQATADLNNMERQLRDNTEALERAANPTEDMAEEVHDLGDNADDAGKKVFTLGDLIKANLISEAIIGGVKALGAAMVSIASGVKDAVAETIDYAGEIADMSAKTGVAAEELQKYSYAAKMSGMEMETLEKAMIKSQKSFADAKTGSKTLQESYKSLGIDISKISNSSDAFDKTIRALADLKDETKRNALANDIFGKSYAEMAPLLNEGSKGIEDLKKKAQELGVVLSEDAINSGEALGDTLDTLKLTMAGVANSLVSLLLPGLSDLATKGTEYLKEFSSNIKNAKGDMGIIGKVVGDTLGDLVSKIADKLPDIIAGAKGLILSFVGGITENLPKVAESGVSIVADLVKALIDALPNIVDSGFKTILSLADGITKSIPSLIPSIIDVVIKIADTVISNIGTIVDSGIEILMALVNGIVEALPTLIEEIPRIINSFSDAIYEQLPKILKAGIDILMALIKGIIDNIPTLIDNLPQIILAIINVITLYNWASLGKSVITKLGDGITAMKGNIGNIAKDIANGVSDAITNIFKGGLSWGKNLISSMGEGISSMRNYLANSAKSIGTEALNSIKSAFSGAFDIGKNLIQGIWNGITSVKDWILGKIGGFAGNIIDEMKAAFGIHSPSTVFRDEVGKNLALGLGLGFTDEMKKVSDDMSSSIPTNFDTELNVSTLNNSIPTSEINRVNTPSNIVIQLIADGKKIAEVVAPYSDVIQGNGLRLAGRGLA